MKPFLLAGLVGSIVLLMGSASLAQPTESMPEFSTGNDVLATCTSEGTANFWACMGYLKGIIDGEAYADLTNARVRRVCLPPTGATNGQIKDVVVEGLRRVPQTRHYPGGFLTIVILQQAFPCPAASRNSN